MAKDPIKKAENGTYYFRANLGFHPITRKQIQKYKSGFKTKKEAREAYSKLMLTSTEDLTEKKQQLYRSYMQRFQFFLCHALIACLGKLQKVKGINKLSCNRISFQQLIDNTAGEHCLPASFCGGIDI